MPKLSPLIILVLAPSVAVAQQAVEGVTITAEDPKKVRAAPGRRSYSLDQDLRTASGSLAEALQAIPSIEIDPRGKLTLRGAEDVTITIDGRPAAEFRGEGAGAALQDMPASRFERVEVITSPSAAEAPDGAGGVINLVTRRARGEGWSGQARAASGDRGRYVLGVNGGYNARALAITADLSLRGEVEEYVMTDIRALGRPAVLVDGRQAVAGGSDALTGRLAADYDVGPSHFSGGVRFSYRDYAAQERLTLAIDDPVAGPALFDRDGRNAIVIGSGEVFFGYRRKFDGDEDVLTVDLRREGINQDVRRAGVHRPGTVASGFDATQDDRDATSNQLKIERRMPLWGGGAAFGYQLDRDHNFLENLIFRGADAAAAVLTSAGAFSHDQTIHAGYATWRRTAGKFTVLAGVRGEETRVDTLSPLTGVTGETRYGRLYPSLNLRVAVSETTTVGLGYSRRVTRPNTSNINPARVTRDAYTFWQGNPAIRPQMTDAVEGVLEYRRGTTSLTATPYYRDSDDAATIIYNDLGGGVVLITPANLGVDRRRGLDIALTGRLSKALSYAVSGGVARATIATRGPGAPIVQSGKTGSARLSLDWQPTPKDTVQITASAPARRFYVDGGADTNPTVNFGYRRRLDSQSVLLFTVTDVFDRQGFDEGTRTPGLINRLVGDFAGRKWTLSLVRTFGGRPREAAFDYGG